MSTQLSKQLRHLGLSKGFNRKHGAKVSLIHDPKEAANLSSEDIFTACLGGYMELCRLDSRFVPFQSTLFAGVPKEREQRTKSEDEKVQKSITAFCRLLTDHFLEPATFKALEHLVRSYKVHVYNVDALMHCALPYHETQEFQQLMRILNLKGTIWYWLKGVQDAGVALPRSAIVSRCSKDTAFLKFIGEMVECSACAEFHSQIVFSFYMVVVCEMLHAVAKVTEEKLQCLVHYIFAGLLVDSELAPDFRSASYGIAMVLMEKTTLSEKLLTALLEALVGGENEELRPQVLTIVCMLYATQQQYSLMPNNVFKLMVKMNNLGPILGGLVKRGLNANAMLKVLASKLLDKLPGKAKHRMSLKSLLSNVPFSENLVELVVEKILNKGMEAGGEESPAMHEAVQEVMRLLDVHFPAELDCVVNNQFQAQGARVRKRSKTGKRRRETLTEEQQVKRKKLMGYLQHCLAGTLHQPVSDSCDLMLSLAVDAPQAETRRMALEQLAEFVRSQNVQSHAKKFANDAILRRLEDDNFNVVHAAMKCPFDVSYMGVGSYFCAVQSSFDRAAHAVWKQDCYEGDALGVVLQGVQILGLTIAKAHGYQPDRIFAHLLGFVLIPGPNGLEISTLILKVLSEVPHPLMRPIHELTKNENCDGRMLISDLVQTLGSNLESTLNMVLDGSSLRTQHVIMLSMVRACSSQKGEEALGVCHVALAMVLRLWNLLEGNMTSQQPSENVKTVENPGDSMFDEEGMPTEQHLSLTAENGHVAACLSIEYLLLLVLKILGGSGKPHVCEEMLEDLALRILELDQVEKFESHFFKLLEVAEIGGMSRWAFLARIVGFVTDRENEAVHACALQALRRCLEVACSNSSIQKPDAAALLVLLPHIFVSISSYRDKVRKNGCSVLGAMVSLLDADSAGHDVLKDNIKALLTSPKMAIGNLQGDSTAIQRLTCQHLATESGKQLGLSLKSLIYPCPRISSGKVCLFIVKCLAGSKSDDMLLLACLPIIRSLLGFESEHVIPALSQVPQDVSIKLGQEILMQYTASRIEVLCLHDKQHFEEALELMIRTLNMEEGVVAKESGEQVEFITEMRVLFCEKAVGILGMLETGELRAALFRSLLMLETYGVSSRVKDAAREALRSSIIKAEDFLPHLNLIYCGSQACTPEMQFSLIVGCLPALEMIQWMPGIEGAPQLMQAVQDVASALLPFVKIHANLNEGNVEYLTRVCLSALKILVNRAESMETVAGLKVPLIVEYLRHSSNGSVRNLALELLSGVAKNLPNQTLDHVLEILKLMGETGIFEDDKQSQQVAAKALAATVPAWVHAGKDMKRLWQSALVVLPGANILHRVPILESVLKPMPQVEGLSSALLVILDAYLNGKNTGSTSAWMLGTARTLSKKVPLSLRVQAFAQCLVSVEEEEAEVENRRDHEQLPSDQLSLSLIKFISSEVQSFPSQTTDEPHSHAALAVSKTCEVLLHRTLEMLSKCSHKIDDKEVNAEYRQSKRELSTALIHLVESLKVVMDRKVYIQSMVSFVGTCSEGVVQHALKLFSETMREIEGEMASSHDTQYLDSLAPAALQICDPIVQLLNNVEYNPVAQQMGLAATQSCVLLFGRSHAETFSGLLESIVTLLETSSSLELKGSALVTTAAMIKGLGSGAVPYLPKFVPVVLGTAESAVASLPSSDASSQAERSDLGAQAPDSDLDKQEQIILDLIGGIMVIREMANHLGDFLSPYLKQMLGIVLSSKVLHCQDTRCSSLAKSTAADIAQCVPPRLLLTDLFGRLDHARDGGEESLVQLMELVRVIASNLEQRSAQNYGDQIFMFLLRVLDIRQQNHLSIRATHTVEVSCISAIEELVMKLTEKQFKPLFMRTIEWSHIKVEEGGGPNLGRRVTFFHLVGRLVHRLRSLFVTYVGIFLEDMIKSLLMVEIAHQHKKKKKAGKDKEKREGISSWDRQNMYMLRLYMIRGLHRFCLSDMAGFLTSENLEEVCPALVHQLKVGEPLELNMEELSFLELDLELEGGLVLASSAEIDPLGTAIVSCLVKIAVMSGSEDMWKLVNSSVLKAARKASKYVRILVVEFVRELVGSLKEDFLPLVPETLPQLAEFLEDLETDVSNRAREVVRSLEALSGENYDQYLK